MFVEDFCLLIVCGDIVVPVCEDGLACGVIVTVFVVETAYKFV